MAKGVMILFSFLCIAGGLVMFGSARSAIHEIEGLVLFLMACVLFAGAAITDVIDKLRAELRTEH